MAVADQALDLEQEPPRVHGLIEGRAKQGAQRGVAALDRRARPRELALDQRQLFFAIVFVAAATNLGVDRLSRLESASLCLAAGLAVNLGFHFRASSAPGG